MTVAHKKIALLSVTDKTAIDVFARGLSKLGFQLLSTGGTAKLLKDQGIQVTEIADYTQFAEILHGRVKTLHPKIFGGILFDPELRHAKKEIESNAIDPIQLVCVNLYDFANQGKNQKSLEQAIEYIDIGGPSLLRAAAKNYRHCTVVIDPNDYQTILKAIEHNQLTDELRVQLAQKVFAATALYDSTIAQYFAAQLEQNQATMFPCAITLSINKKHDLRYGENPTQQAAFYIKPDDTPHHFANCDIIQGKELSYNNYLDLDSAYRLVNEFSQTAVAIIKHTNPCAIAISHSENVSDTYEKALSSDPQSAFGGIVACNKTIDERTAKLMSEIFLECIIAPQFTPAAQRIFSSKKNLRLVAMPFDKQNTIHFEVRSILGGYLLQTPDINLESQTIKTVTIKQASSAELADLKFAMRVAKHVKSNAIVIAKSLQTIGIGAGQMSRIDAVKLAKTKAEEVGHNLDQAVLASDGFFPFRDCLDFAAATGIRSIIQPGGSMRDQESIDAANEHHMVMVFTGTRHFKH